MSLSKLNKYCACHEKWISWLILDTNETLFTMRGATCVIVQTHQILRLPRKMTVQNLKEICWKRMKRHFQCAADPTMIRPWSENDPRMKPSVRNPPRNRGYLSRPPRAFCIEKYNISRSGYHSKFHRILRLPRKVTLALHQILRLPRKVILALHQILRLPRKVILALHQILRLPRKVTLALHQILRLPRKVTLALHQILRLPRKVTLELHLLLDWAITWLNYLWPETMTWLNYYLTELLTWLNYYLTLWLDWAMTWLSELLLDRAMTWLSYYLTEHRAITWLNYYLTELWLNYYLTERWLDWDWTMLLLDWAMTSLSYDLRLWLDRAMTWLSYYLTEHRAITWLNYYLTELWLNYYLTERWLDWDWTSYDLRLWRGWAITLRSCSYIGSFSTKLPLININIDINIRKLNIHHQSIKYVLNSSIQHLNFRSHEGLNISAPASWDCHCIHWNAITRPEFARNEGTKRCFLFSTAKRPKWCTLRSLSSWNLDSEYTWIT